MSLEQSRKRERALEEEGRRLAEERADALRLLKELQGEERAVGVREDKSMRFISRGICTQSGVGRDSVSCVKMLQQGLNQSPPVDSFYFGHAVVRILLRQKK